MELVPSFINASRAAIDETPVIVVMAPLATCAAKTRFFEAGVTQAIRARAIQEIDLAGGGWEPNHISKSEYVNIMRAQ